MGFGTNLVGNHHLQRGLEFTIRNQVLSPFEILLSATGRKCSNSSNGGQTWSHPPARAGGCVGGRR